MADAERDGNFVTTLLAVSSVDGVTPVTLYADPTTHRLLTDLAGGGSGTVTSVSVVSANGFAGSVATATTTPAITLSTTVNAPVLAGNGTAIAAATTTGSGSTVVLATDAVLVTPNLGTPSALVATNATGTATALNIGGNAGTVTVADAGADTTTFVLLATDATGSLSPRTDAGLSYNASTNVLTSTGGFVGALTGNADTVTWANEATDTTCFVGFATAASGSLAPKTNTNLTFNSNTGVLTSASSVLTTTDINGGTIDGTTIGASSATTIIGTTITATALRASSNDSGSIGVSGTAFSDLFLASGALIDFAAGNSVITHSSAILTVSTGDLRVTTAGTNTASVVTVGGSQTLTSKTLTSPTINTANIGGLNLLAEGGSIALDPALSADGTWSGITMTGTSGYTQAFGDLVYLDPTGSRWEAADANSASGADGDARGMLAMVVVAGTDGNSCTLLLQGNIRADAKFATFTINNPLYVSETAGAITQTQPVTTDVVIRIVGAALTADSIYFDPDKAWITHT